MRIDWEGEIKHNGQMLYVHADYIWDYDDNGKHMVVVTKFKAYGDLDTEVELDFNFSETIAEIIQDELENAA